MSTNDQVMLGVDEVGRGSVAGPIVVGACVLAPADAPAGLADSKRLNRAARRRTAVQLATRPHVLCWIAPTRVDTIGPRAAVLAAMRAAVLALCTRLPSTPPIIIDGPDCPNLDDRPARAQARADTEVPAVAAAANIAKHARDTWMRFLAHHHPGYGWERNAGYGTPEHLDAVRRHGRTRYHRHSFLRRHDAPALV